MIGAKNVQYAGHCIVSNFWLDRDSHMQILTAMETPSAPTLARSNFVCHLLVDRHDFFYLLHQHCRVTSLRIIQSPCISWIGIGENCAVRSFTFGFHLLPTPESSECLSHTEVWNAVAPGRAENGHVKEACGLPLHPDECGLVQHP